MIAKIRIQFDPKLSARYPRKWPARVEIVKRSGERLIRAIEHPNGDSENPLSESEVVGKFKSLTRELIADDLADAICQRALSLERTPEVSTLLTP